MNSTNAPGKDEAQTPEHRTIVVGLVWNRRNELLFCKMPNNRGVFPDQWGLPGGGIESNEKMTDALIRELREELGIAIKDIKPAKPILLYRSLKSFDKINCLSGIKKLNVLARGCQ